MTKELEIARRLYGVMPDAQMPPADQGTGMYLWGEVESTPRFEFCQQIAREILRVNRATRKAL
jgi:hypothetical protein